MARRLLPLNSLNPSIRRILERRLMRKRLSWSPKFWKFMKLPPLRSSIWSPLARAARSERSTQPSSPNFLRTWLKLSSPVHKQSVRQLLSPAPPCYPGPSFSCLAKWRHSSRKRSQRLKKKKPRKPRQQERWRPPLQKRKRKKPRQLRRSKRRKRSRPKRRHQHQLNQKLLRRSQLLSLLNSKPGNPKLDFDTKASSVWFHYCKCLACIVLYR